MMYTLHFGRWKYLVLDPDKSAGESVVIGGAEEIKERSYKMSCSLTIGI